MKTLIFPSEFSDNRGGVPQSTIALASGLSASGNYLVVIVCPKDSEMSKVHFTKNVRIVTTPQTQWTISKFNPIGTIYTAFSIYKCIIPFLKSDAWIITNQPVTSSLVALMPCSHIPEIYINRGGNLNGHSPVGYFIRYKLKHHIIDAAIGISRRQIDVLLAAGQTKERVYLIHNGLSLPTRDYSFTQLNKQNLRISTMGFISDLKNQKEGVKLIKLLRDNGINAVLNLYGDPDDDKQYQQEIAELINQLKVKDHINFCGFVSGEDLFSETDVLISFSKSEGFGRSIVEGMLRKKPVIAWRGAGGPVDITDDGKYCHLVQTNNANEYYEIILQLLNNPKYNEQNTIESYQYAMNNFTTSCMVNKYVELFNKICK